MKIAGFNSENNDGFESETMTALKVKTMTALKVKTMTTLKVCSVIKFLLSHKINRITLRYFCIEIYRPSTENYC